MAKYEVEIAVHHIVIVEASCEDEASDLGMGALGTDKEKKGPRYSEVTSCKLVDEKEVA